MAKWPKKMPFIRVPIYSNMRVYITGSIEEYRQALSSINEPEPPLGIGGVSESFSNSRTGEKFFLIGVFYEDEDGSTLAHECGHLAFSILKRVGVDPTEGANEAYCYLLGWLVSEIGKVLRKKYPSILPPVER